MGKPLVETFLKAVRLPGHPQWPDAAARFFEYLRLCDKKKTNTQCACAGRQSYPLFVFVTRVAHNGHDIEMKTLIDIQRLPNAPIHYHGSANAASALSAWMRYGSPTAAAYRPEKT